MRAPRALACSQLLQHERRRRPRPARSRRGPTSHGRLAVRRIVVARRQRARRAEAADAERRHGRLGAARDHDVGVAVLDEPRRLADAVVRRRARADRARGSAPCSRSGSTPGPAIMLMIEPGTKNGEILRRPPCEVRLVRLLDHRQAADARADAHADALLVAGRSLEAGVAAPPPSWRPGRSG